MLATHGNAFCVKEYLVFDMLNMVSAMFHTVFDVFNLFCSICYIVFDMFNMVSAMLHTVFDVLSFAFCHVFYGV